MSNTVERVNNGRCAWCDLVCVDAWICDACAIGTMPSRVDDGFVQSATLVSRAYQRRNDAGAAYDQFAALQSCGSEFQTPSERKVRQMSAHASGLGLTRADYRRVSAVVIPNESWVVGKARRTQARLREGRARRAAASVRVP